MYYLTVGLAIQLQADSQLCHRGVAYVLAALISPTLTIGSPVVNFSTSLAPTPNGQF